MKSIFHTLLITYIFFSNSACAMELDTLNIKADEENQIQITQLPPKEIIVHIIGYCRPKEKNALMKVCKDFNTWLQDRILIIQANPSTVSFDDKIKGMFCDSKNLLIWTKSLQPSDINRKNILGMTPFHVASNNEAATQWLIQNGANKNEIEPSISPLHEAVYKGDIESVRVLLKRFNLNLNLANEITPLYIAVNEDYTDIVQLLLTADADANRKNGYRETPLHRAVFKGNTDIVRLLLGVNGINLNQVDIFGYTPLIIAVRKSCTDIIQLLINAKANVNQTDNYGWTPLIEASLHGNTDIIQLLLQSGADVNQADNNGCSPLIIASSHGRTEAVLLLLQSSANVNQSITVDDCYFKKGDTALQIAQEFGRTQIVDLIEEHMRHAKKV